MLDPVFRSRAASLARGARVRSEMFHLLVMALFGAATVLSLRPLLVNAADGVAVKATGDQLWQVSLLDGQLRAALSEPGAFFHGYFYYGMGDALYGSDLLIGLLLIFAPIRLVTGNADLAFNLTWHAAFWLNAVLMYVATLSLTRNRWAALVAGTLFGFGAIQVNYAQSHFQYAGSWWIPLTFLFSIRFVRSKGWKDFAAAVLCVWLEFTTVVMLSYVAAFVLFVFAVVPGVWWSARNRNWQVPLQMLLSAALISAAFAPVVLGYLEFSVAWNAERDITEVQSGSLQLRDYLSPSSRLQWYEPLRQRFPVPTGERRAFPGFLPLVVGVLGLALATLAIRRQRRYAWIGLGALGLGIVTVILTLGPHWKWHESVTDIELPYLFLFEHFPNFRAVRVVARFAVMGNFALAVLASVAVVVVAKRLTNRPNVAGLLAAVITFGILIESLTVPLNVSPLPRDDNLNELLRASPKGPTMFVPLSGGVEIRRLWFANKADIGPLVNGYSGFIWPQYWYFRDVAKDVTNEDVANLAQALSAYGIRNIVLDRNMLSGESSAVWDTLSERAVVEFVLDVGDWRLIRLVPSTTPGNGAWSEVETSLLLMSAPQSAGIQTWLAFANRDDQPWVPRDGSRVRRAVVTWRGTDEQSVLEFETPFLPPPLLATAYSHAAVIHLFTPSGVGRYRLTITVEGEVIADQPVEISDSVPRPFDGIGEGLGAAFKLVSNSKFEGRPGEKFRIHVDAINTGDVAWVGDANIRLGWRWYRVLPDGQEIELPQYEGRLPLTSHLTGDVWPGNGFSFRGVVGVPDEPGEFKVRISMVSEMVAWFDAAPVEVNVVLRHEE